MYFAEWYVLVENDISIALLPPQVPEQPDSITTEEEVLSLLLTAAEEGTGSVRERTVPMSGSQLLGSFSKLQGPSNPHSN